MRVIKQTISYSLIVLLVLTTVSCCQDSKKAEKAEDGFSFIFMTDIHLEPDRHAPEGFQMAIDSINKLNPDFVLTGGDLVADALGVGQSRADSLYKLYKDMASGINCPVYNTMGNHEVFGVYKNSGVSVDDPLYGEKMFEKQIGERYYTFEHKGWRFFVLDGIEEAPERYYYGAIDSIQAQWISEQLKTVPAEQPIVISVHIPFITVQTQIKGGALAANSQGLVLNNSKEILELFKGHKLKLVLQGHLHFLEDIYTGGVHFITGGAVSSAWWRGKRDGLEEGFLKIDVKGDSFEWEYIDYGWEVPEETGE